MQEREKKHLNELKRESGTLFREFIRCPSRLGPCQQESLVLRLTAGKQSPTAQERNRWRGVVGLGCERIRELYAGGYLTGDKICIKCLIFQLPDGVTAA